jgi:hypothetical protein
MNDISAQASMPQPRGPGLFSRMCDLRSGDVVGYVNIDGF